MGGLASDALKISPQKSPGFPGRFSLVSLGLRDTPAGLAQVIFTLVPLNTLLLAQLHGLEKIRLRSVICAIVGSGGIAIVVGSLGGVIPTAISITELLCATLCTAEAFVLAKVLPIPSALLTIATGMTVGAVILLLLSLVTGEVRQLPHQSLTWFALIFNGIGSALLFALYFRLLRILKVSTLSYVFLLSPLAAIGLSAILDHEGVTLPFLIGGIVVLGSVYIGIRPPALR